MNREGEAMVEESENGKSKRKVKIRLWILQINLINQLFEQLLE